MPVKIVAYFLLLGLFLGITGCFTSRNIESASINNERDIAYCDTVTRKSSVFIKNVDAKIRYESKNYNSKVSLYYLVDSMIVISAANAGFEIIRAGIYKDSIVIINRIDKLVYRFFEKNDRYSLPLNYDDFILIINKFELCNEVKGFDNELIDLSIKDITKKLVLNSTRDSINNLEFFHKKTGEYIIGERVETNEMLIYANYVMGNFEIKVSGGKVTYNEILDYNANYNASKYTIIDL